MGRFSGKVVAITVPATIPVFLLFIILQRGLGLSGLKG